MSECTTKKDFGRIQKNRCDFQAQQGPRGPKSKYDTACLILFSFNDKSTLLDW